MRYVVIGFCVLAVACGEASPTAPTFSTLPFTGTYDGLETVGTDPNEHHLDATGNATQLGPFTVAAEWTLAATGNFGTGTWTAANGDKFSTTFARSGVAAPPVITFTETHIVASGTGRFANASGTFTVVQTRGLSMPYNNSATIDGTISVRR